MTKTLGELAPGENGYIASVGAQSPQLKRRLTDMGITPLTQVFVRKVAPMGDPIEIHLRGYDLSIRRADALEIALFTPEEAQSALENEQAREAERRARADELLKTHGVSDDRAAHQSAVRLTQWAVTSQGEHPSPPPPAKGAQIAPAAHNLKECKGHCATCGKCGAPFARKRRARADAPAPDDQPVKLALVGNPNSGKTTLFNAMTGAREYVGNWPGVTVEKKEGKIRAHGHDMTLVDLPGIYSLSPYSLEEVIARNYIVQEKPDAIINIVDGTNLERNLYLTVQLIEMERPLIIAINMMDEVEKNGDTIDIRALSLELGVPVVPISARTGAGVEELVNQCALLLALAHEQMHRGFHIEPDHVYDAYTHAAHHEIGNILGDAATKAGLPPHWAQIKLLEGDALVHDALALTPAQQTALEQIIARYAGDDPRFDNTTRVAESRYRFIARAVTASLKRRREAGEKSFSDRLDAVLTNKYLAIPIFLLVMFAIFALTFGTVGAWLSDQVDLLLNGALAPLVREWLTNIGTSAWLVGLVCDGAIAGVGAVLTFLPWIAILFLCLSLLEDSGYLSRTAFIMDKLLRRFGLSGKSFIPMLMGFGCTVPATMGARTIENAKDRRMTILLLPFMSCSAKIPVYGLIAGAFFAEHRVVVVFSLYVLGIIAGICTGILFKSTLFKGEDAPFVMEMPPYRRPTLKNTLQHVQERVAHFLTRAGTIILLMSMVIWLLQSFDIHFQMVENAADSMLGRFGSALAPAFAPLGFGAWQAVVALLAGFVAKEAVVSTLSLFYGFTLAAGDTAVRASLAGTFTPLSAYSYLVFVLLYVPCMAAVATMRRELGSMKWTAFMIAYQIAIAYVAALAIYQLGTFIGLG